MKFIYKDELLIKELLYEWCKKHHAKGDETRLNNKPRAGIHHELRSSPPIDAKGYADERNATQPGYHKCKSWYQKILIIKPQAGSSSVDSIGIHKPVTNKKPPRKRDGLQEE